MTNGTRRGEGSASRPGRSLPPGKTRHVLYRRLGGPVWKNEENLAPTGIRSPDLPAHCQSLYRLSYPAHAVMDYLTLNHVTFQVLCHVTQSSLMVWYVTTKQHVATSQRLEIQTTCTYWTILYEY